MATAAKVATTMATTKGATTMAKTKGVTTMEVTGWVAIKVVKPAKEAIKAVTAAMKAIRLFLYSTFDIAIKINDIKQNNIK